MLLCEVITGHRNFQIKCLVYTFTSLSTSQSTKISKIEAPISIYLSPNPPKLPRTQIPIFVSLPNENLNRMEASLLSPHPALILSNFISTLLFLSQHCSSVAPLSLSSPLHRMYSLHLGEQKETEACLKLERALNFSGRGFTFSSDFRISFSMESRGLFISMNTNQRPRSRIWNLPGGISLHQI